MSNSLRYELKNLYTCKSIVCPIYRDRVDDNDIVTAKKRFTDILIAIK